jgi:hypothetical protein
MVFCKISLWSHNEALAVITVKEGPTAVSPSTATETVPEVAFSGTSTVNCVAEADVTVAAVPLNSTLFWVLVPLKLVPVMVTSVPTTPLVGAIAVMVGFKLIGSSSTTGSLPPSLLQLITIILATVTGIRSLHTFLHALDNFIIIVFLKVKENYCLIQNYVSNHF